MLVRFIARAGRRIVSGKFSFVGNFLFRAYGERREGERGREGWMDGMRRGTFV